MSIQELSNRRKTLERGAAAGPGPGAWSGREVRVRRGFEIRGLRVLLATFLVAGVVIPAFAKNDYDRTNSKGNQFILRAAKADVGRLAVQYGLVVSGELPTTDGFAALVEAPLDLGQEQVKNLLRADPRVASVSPVSLATLPGTDAIQPAVGDVAGDLEKVGDFTTPCLAQGFSELLWSGYADQEAVRQIRLHEAQAASVACGTALVAVIDTGVDPSHPLLAGALVEGYDFVLEAGGVPSEWSILNQSVAAILEQSVAAILEQSVAAILEGEGQPLDVTAVTPILDQSVAAILEGNDVPSFFGHGTMVAGLVRVAAPAAQIMPLRVFDGTGHAHLFDVVRAIYYAVDHGADVINMSFSMGDPSPELVRAVQYAQQHGVVCVASAGNEGQRAHVYPAALGAVVGVGAVADDDILSNFSNYGSGLVTLAAPGEGIVSAYPGGLYGAAWGTSFSAPLVAGVLALGRQSYGAGSAATHQAMTKDLIEGSALLSSLDGLVTSGRLDALGTVLAARE